MRGANLSAKVYAWNCLLFVRRKGTTFGKHRYIQKFGPRIQNCVVFSRKNFASDTQENLKTQSLNSLEGNDNVKMSVKRVRLDVENCKSKASKAACSASLEVISNGTTHTSPCVVLKTDKKNYLFNCPEGTCRFHSSIRLRPNTIFDYFITRGNWDCFGGVSAVLMSKDDVSWSSPQECRLHGPKGIRQYLQELRPFLDSEKSSDKYSMLMEERNYEREFYEDEVLTVKYIPLFGSGDQKDVDVAYFVELAMPPMKVDFLKIIELKIPPGPLIGELKDGYTTVLPDGRTIRPEQIYSDEQTGKPKSFLVVDVTSEAKLDCLAKSTVIQKFLNGSEQLGYIVHFTPEEIFALEEYQKWMQLFGQECEHIVVNGSGTVAPQIEAPYLQQMMLNTLDPIGFPLLYPRDFNGVVSQDDGGECLAPNVFVPTSLKRFSVLGRLSMNNLIVFPFNDSGLASRINTAPEATSLIEELHEYLKSIADREEDKYPQITFLGTSSATPTRYRNLSGHLLHLSDESVIMIDCGEMTYGQMRVHYGEQKCEQILLNLHAICITHAHQDHLNGLILLLEKREIAFKKHGLEYKPLILVSNRLVRKPLSIYSSQFRNLEKLVVAIDALNLMTRPPDLSSNNHEEEANRMSHFPTELFSREQWNLADLEAVKVKHVAHSCGFIFTDAKHGRKVVFSGDTRPCDLLVGRGKNCDILVHEATFQDILKEDASHKKHSTMEEAVDIGCRMNAKHVFLTHFSARYNKIPLLPDYLLNTGNFSIAMDNMVVRFDRLDVFPKLLPIYRHIYLEELLKADELTIRFAAARKQL